MGCPAWFLAEKGTYSTERFFGTLAQAAFEIDAMFLYQGGRSYDEHFQLDFATVNIMYRYGVEYDNVVVRWIRSSGRTAMCFWRKGSKD